jgi:hypothetical protein
MIYQVVFSHVKLPHLGMNKPSPNIFHAQDPQFDPGRKQWIDEKILITIFSRSKASRHKFGHG